MTTLGVMVQQKRKELGLSQEKLAEKIGKTAGYVGQIERGLSNPSYTTLAKIIEVLDLDVYALFFHADFTEKGQRRMSELIQLFSRLSPKQQHLALGILKLIARYDV